MANIRILDNIVNGYRNSNISKVCKSETTNLVYESQGADASSKAILRSIAGSRLYLEMPEARCRGIYVAPRGPAGSPVVYTVYGEHLYLVLEEPTGPKAYRIGRLSAGVDGAVSMTCTNGYGDAAPHLVVADGSQTFAVNTTLSPGRQSADWKSLRLPLRAGSSTKLIVPTHVAYLYGYLAVLDAGTDAFYLSYQYPFETLTDAGEVDYDVWQTERFNGTGFAVYSEWSADSSRALIEAGSYLYTFGDRSFQAFSYMEDVDHPFQSPDTAAGQIGIRAPRSVAAVGQAVYWLGSSDIGHSGVYMMTGATATRISNPDLEREIDQLDNPEDAIAQVWQEYGHVFYAITFRAGNRTFVYDTAEGLWHVRSSYDPKRPEQEGQWRPQWAKLGYGKLMFGSLDSNALIVQDPEKWTEWDDRVIVRRRRSGIILDGFSPWFCDSIKLITNSGQLSVGAPPSDPSLTPQLMMRYSWDGGQTWSNQEIGAGMPLGRYEWVVQWDSLGMGELMDVEISTSDPWPWAIISAKVQGEGMSVL